MDGPSSSVAAALASPPPFDPVATANAVLAAIILRDSTERDPFKDLVASYSDLSVRDRERRALKSQNKELQERVKLGEVRLLDYSRQEVGGMASTTRTRELEAKLLSAQEDLTSSYKNVASHASQVLELQDHMRKLTLELNTAKAEVDDLKEELVRVQKSTTHLSRTVEERGNTIQTLQDEIQAGRLHIQVLEDQKSKLDEANRILQAQNLAQTMLQQSAASADGAPGAPSSPSGKGKEAVNVSASFFRQRASTVAGVRSQSGALANAGAPAMPADAAKYLADATSSFIMSDYSPPTKARRAFVGHDSDVTAVTFAHTGAQFATAGEDGTVKLWESASGMARGTLHGPVQAVMGLDFSHNDALLVGCSNDNSAWVWDVNERKSRVTLTGHKSRVYAARFSSDSQRVVTGSHDRHLNLWEVARGFCLKSAFCQSSVNDVVISMDSTLVCSGHFDGALRFWNFHEMSQVHEVPIEGQITSLAMSADGSKLLVNSRDHKLRLLDLRTFTVMQEFQAPSFRNALNWSRACMSPTGSFLAAGSADHKVYVWNGLTGKLQTTLQKHKGVVACAAWNPMQGTQVVTGGRDRTIVMWE